MRPAREEAQDDDQQQRRPPSEAPSDAASDRCQVLSELANCCRLVLCIPAQVEDVVAQAKKEAQDEFRRRNGRVVWSKSRRETMMSSMMDKQQQHTSIKQLNRLIATNKQQRQSKRIRPTSPNNSELPYRSAAASNNWSPKLVAMLTAGFIVLMLATCYSFAQASGEQTNVFASSSSSSSSKRHSQIQIGTTTARHHSTGAVASPHPNGPESVWPRPSGGSSLRRRFRRATKSQPASLASSPRARPTTTTTSKPQSASSTRQQAQHQASAEVEPLAQQQQQQQRSIKNVTAQNGQSVLLHCLVEPTTGGELPEVSWFRGTGEPQLLTYDTTTIIRDERFLVRQGIARPNDWALQIRSLNKTTDAGLYQCQTSGDSPQLQSYQLNIVEPQVDILGAPDLAIRLGAPINLTCVISQSADELQFVFWYRDERMINYDFANETRAKIVLSKWSQQRDSITSNLQIFQSRLSDSGNYTCAPSGARPSSIQVHVLEATDKRLMMFQQDESNPMAASSHQTNSAISTHVIRLSRGRAYAFLVGFFILATWFQLIAQLQTLISLVLVAIIGLLLGQTTGANSETGRRRTTLDMDDVASVKKAEGGSLGGPVSESLSDYDESDCKPNGGSLEKQRLVAPSSPLKTKTATTEHHKEHLDCRVISSRRQDPLLRGAEEALCLLRTLGDAETCLVDNRPNNSNNNNNRALSSCSSVELDDDDDDDDDVDDDEAFRSISFGALDEQTTRRVPSYRTPLARIKRKQSHLARPPSERLDLSVSNSPNDNQNNDNNNLDNSRDQTIKANHESQASPASSNMSSAASTGYNSDSTRLCSSSMGVCLGGGHVRMSKHRQPKQQARTTPNVSLLQAETRQSDVDLDADESHDELEVIELIKDRPTAMRLIIEHLQQSGQLDTKLAELSTNSMGRNRAGSRIGDKKIIGSTIYSVPARSSTVKADDVDDDDDDDDSPLDLSRGELAKRSASATFGRPD